MMLPHYDMRSFSTLPKFCIDCKHYRAYSNYLGQHSDCRRPELSLVTGKLIPRTNVAADERKLGLDLCGPEAKYFEAEDEWIPNQEMT